MSLTLQTDPATGVYPVSLDLVKEHSVVEHANDDTLLTAYLKAATVYCENYMRKDIVSRTWDYSFDSFPTDEIIRLPRTPVLEIVSITYNDYSGSPVSNTIASSVYVLDTGKAYPEVHLQEDQEWPSVESSHNAITVRFRTGFLDTDVSPIDFTQLPETVKTAVLMIVDDLYRNRATQDTIKLYSNTVADMLLAQNRNYAV